MKEQSKKVISLILIFSILFTGLPTYAFAQNPQSEEVQREAYFSVPKATTLGTALTGTAEQKIEAGKELAGMLKDMIAGLEYILENSGVLINDYVLSIMDMAEAKGYDYVTGYLMGNGAQLFIELYAGYKAAKAAGNALKGADTTVPTKDAIDNDEILLLPEPYNTNPWKEGTDIISMEAPSNCYINMALSPGQNKPGGWGTFDEIPSVSYVRNELAVTPEFKQEISHVQTYLIPEGTQIQIGIVGPQEYNGIVYPGGGNQVNILNFSDRENLIPIGDKVEIY